MSLTKRCILKKKLEEELKDELNSGKLKPGMPILSASKLSRKYGVSPLTANNALNSLVEEGLLYRRRGSGTYVADNSEKSYKILLGFEQNFFSELPNTLEAIFRRIEKNKLLDKKHSRNISLRELNSSLLEDTPEKPDAAVILRRYVNDDTIGILEKLGIPVLVFLHEQIEDLPFHQIITDPAPGMKEIIRDIKSSKASRVFIAGRNIKYHTHNIDLFKRHCKNEGLPPPEEFIQESMLGDQGRLAGYTLTDKILSTENIENSAIVCSGGLMALGILDRLKEKGLEQYVNIYSFSNAFGLLEETPSGRMISSLDFSEAELADTVLWLLENALENKVASPVAVRIPTYLRKKENAL